MLRAPARLLATVVRRELPLAGGVLHRRLSQVFGPPPFDPARDPGDPGLFGPASASWQVIGEPAAIVGGLRALLVQLLHPAAIAGVSDHSAFRDDPLGRLQRTSAYVGGTTFGSLPEVLALARTVRQVHRGVAGTTPEGQPYRADDPHLLAWISIALTSSFLATDRAYALRPVGEVAADAFVAEQSRAAALLDPRVDLADLAADGDALAELAAGTLPLPMLDEGRLPQSAAELDAALARYRPELGVGEQGRAALRFLLWPDLDPAIKAGYLPVLAGAVATLDTDQRRLLGLPGGRVIAAAIELQVQSLLTAVRLAGGPAPSARAAARRVAAGAPQRS